VNRQIYPPNALFPLRGDVSAEAGATSVIVIGIQTIPVSPILPSLTVPQTLVAIGGAEYIPTDLDTSIQINGVPVSDDYDIGINLLLSSNSDSPVLVNGA
jgi:hypothetical protein